MTAVTSYDFDPSCYLTPAQLVERWKDSPFPVSYVTLARWRAAGKNLEFVLAGPNNRVYYHMDAIEAFELSRNPHAPAQCKPVQEQPQGNGEAT